MKISTGGRIMTDAELRNRIKYLYEKGMDIQKIAWILDITRKEVKQAVKDAGLFGLLQDESIIGGNPDETVAQGTD